VKRRRHGVRCDACGRMLAMSGGLMMCATRAPLACYLLCGTCAEDVLAYIQLMKRELAEK
jgi:heme O synthase-like polyprenyltransferase